MTVSMVQDPLMGHTTVSNEVSKVKVGSGSPLTTHWI